MTAFLDSVAIIGTVDRRDQYHPVVASYMAGYVGRILTTDWVLSESLDALSNSRTRMAAVDLIDRLRVNPVVEIIGYDDALYRRGLDVYRKRPDKEWSLTDCISFVVMEQQKLTDALTADHHFRQAGFNPIFEKVT